MKKSTINIITAFLLVFYVSPCKGSIPNIVKEELKLIVEEIQGRVKSKKNITQQLTSPLIVAIGGCPGIGKSTISQLLKTTLTEDGLTCVIIHLDHYGLSQEERKQFVSEFDPRRFEWLKIHHTLDEITKGLNEIVKPTINQLTKEMGQETLSLTHVDCILFEGSYALGNFSPMNFLQYMDLTVYLESPLENIFDWKWQRELKKSSPLTPEPFFIHMMEVVKDFAYHIYPSRKNADFIIYIDFFHHYSVIDCSTLKNGFEPDFNALRLEMLTY